MKKKTMALVVSIVLAASCLVLPFPVNAAHRAIIVPKDYSTIEDAINAASNGDTVFISRGNYEGFKNQTLVINKTITLVGETAETTRLHLNPPLVLMNIFSFSYMGYSDAIRIEAKGVKILGLTIDAPGGNIAIVANGTAVMRNNITISMNVNGDETQIIDNTFLGGVSVVGSHNSVAKNTIGGGVETDGSYNLIADNSVSGERGLYTVDVHDNSSVIFNNTISGGDWPAIHLGYGGRDNLIAKNNLSSGGMELESYSSFNTVCANNLNGWGLALMGFNNTFSANQLGHMGIGGTHGGTVDAAYNRFYHNNFIGDAPELSVYTKAPGPLFWDDGKEGNYWSNYKGSGNKVGTTPYQVYGDYHYFDGAIREDTMVNCGQDNHPLLNLFNVDSVNVALPEWASHLVIEISPPRIAILLLENQTYNQCSVPLGFSLNKPVLWMGYSLDGQENVTVAGNTTLAGLANGNHNVTVYAEDEAGNSGASETLFFSVNVPEPEPSSEIVPVAAVSLAVATVAAAGLFLYGRKRKRAPAKL